MKKETDKKLFYYYNEELKYKREKDVLKFESTHYGINIYR